MLLTDPGGVFLSNNQIFQGFLTILIKRYAHVQTQKASQEIRQQEAEATKKLAEAQATLEEAAQRENAARRATAELQRLDKQLSARKLDAKELQVRAFYICPCLSLGIVASCHA